MKQLVSYILVLIIVLSFAACNSTEQSSNTLSDAYLKVAQEMIEQGDYTFIYWNLDAVATTPCFKNLGYVLCIENGEPFHPDSITQRWERFIAKHHLPSIRLHDLRHSNATALIAAGVSPKIVQHRLGHANVNITLNTYTHVLPSMDDDAAEKLDNALFSATQTVKHPPFII